MDLPKSILNRFSLTDQVLNEWEICVNQAAKLTGFSYYVTHRRLEKAFDGLRIEVCMILLRRWLALAEKETNIPKGMKFNAELKRFKHEREATRK